MPTEADDVVATATSGSLTATTGTTAVCRSLDMSLYTATFTISAGKLLTVGDVTGGTDPPGNNALLFSAAMSFVMENSACIIRLNSQTTTVLNVDFAGKSAAGQIIFGNTSGVNGSWKLTGDLVTTTALTLSRGTLDANGYNVTMQSLTSSGGFTRQIIMGAGQWTITGSGTIVTVSGAVSLTVTRSNPIICNYSGASSVIISAVQNSEAATLDFKFTAGTYALFLTQYVHDVIFDGFAGTFNNSIQNIFGNFLIESGSSGMTLGSGTSALTFSATSGTKTIDLGGKTLDRPLTINGVGGTFQLGDNLTLGATRALTVTNGTFDANNHNVDCGSVSSSNSNVRSILMGSGTWTVRNSGTAWTTATATNLTFNAGTSTLVLADTNNRTINTNVTFYNLSCVVATARTLTFTDGTAPGASNSLTLQGASGQLLTLAGSSTGGWSIGVPSTQSLGYLSVSRSTATGNTAAAGLTSTDGGNNTNWTFGSSSAIGLGGVAMRCRHRSFMRW